MVPRVVVALCGLPGSGKSTLALPLAQRFGLALVDRDRLRYELHPSPEFTVAEKQAANGLVLVRLRAHCVAGESSLVDGMTLSRASERQALEHIAVEHGFRFMLLWLDCPVELAVARVERQAHMAKDRDGAQVREVAARFEPPHDTARLDATLPAEELLRLAEAALA